MERELEQQLKIIAYLEQTLKEIGLCVGCELIYDDNTNIIGCEVSIIGKPNRKIRIDKSTCFFYWKIKIILDK